MSNLWNGVKVFLRKYKSDKNYNQFDSSRTECPAVPLVTSAFLREEHTTLFQYFEEMGQRASHWYNWRGHNILGYFLWKYCKYVNSEENMLFSFLTHCYDILNNRFVSLNGSAMSLADRYFEWYWHISIL